MKNIIRNLCLLMLLAPLSTPALQIGDSWVDAKLKMKNIDSSMVSISDIRGKHGTLVVFTCNHCPFVKAWQDRMVKCGNTYKNKGIGVLFINSNDPAVKGDTFEGMQRLASEYGYQFPYVVDATSDVARHYGATKTPEFFLFDRNGKLVYKGAIDDSGRKPRNVTRAYLKEAIEELLAGNKISTPTTKSVGCSIKFR